MGILAAAAHRYHLTEREGAEIATALNQLIELLTTALKKRCVTVYLAFDDSVEQQAESAAEIERVRELTKLFGR